MHIHMHTHSHAHLHIYIHTHRHSHSHICIQSHTHVHTFTLTHTQTHTLMVTQPSPPSSERFIFPDWNSNPIPPALNPLQLLFCVLMSVNLTSQVPYIGGIICQHFPARCLAEHSPIQALIWHEMTGKRPSTKSLINPMHRSLPLSPWVSMYGMKCPT